MKLFFWLKLKRLRKGDLFCQNDSNGKGNVLEPPRTKLCLSPRAYTKVFVKNNGTKYIVVNVVRAKIRAPSDCGAGVD